MPHYKKPIFSKRQIVRAGRILAAKVPYPYSEEALEAFRIAHNWRNAHILPMIKVRQELLGKGRRVKGKALTAARLKRMSSIRNKMGRQPYTLYQLQDLGGCRIVLDTIQEIDSIAEMYRSGDTRHNIYSEDDYIDNPKIDGYRSRHIVLKYQGRGDEVVYNRQTIELQIRTRLQHAWATAVESVGLVRGESLKSGIGNGDWLRFFEIMSAELAIEEGCPTISSVSENTKERRSELFELEKRLSAIKNLESYNQVIKFTEQYIGPSKFFLVHYDNKAKEVTVKPQFSFSSDSPTFIGEESTRRSQNTVLVEVEKMADLKEAFPNYFLDVRLFTDTLKSIVRDGMSQRKKAKYNLSWLDDYTRDKDRS